MKLPVAILAGGLATRLRPTTEKMPKSLVQVAGRPFAEHQLALLRRSGLTEVVFCVGFLGEMIEATLGDGSRWGMALRYSYDGPQLLGTGGALRRALPLLGDAFLVLYGDSYLECDYPGVAEAFVASGCLGLVTVLHNRNRWEPSNLLYRDGRILAYNKAHPTPNMEHIDYGLGGLRAEVFDAYSFDESIDLAVIHQDLIASGQLAGFEVTQRFYEIGSPSGLEETCRYLAGLDQSVVERTTS